jgi:ABC-type branched-subunit amino acid transport system substrate-binding protein
MQGALFVDAFAGELGADTGALFAQAFQQRTSRTPTAAAAQAHDAAMLIARVRREVGNAAEPRAAFRTAFARSRLDDGACGPAQMGPDGELQRMPSVFEVSGDQLILAP